MAFNTIQYKIYYSLAYISIQQENPITYTNITDVEEQTSMNANAYEHQLLKCKQRIVCAGRNYSHEMKYLLGEPGPMQQSLFVEQRIDVLW